MTLKKYIAAFAAAAICAGTAAQNTNSGYFVDDYAYRFQMNPAIDNSKNFIAIPVLGNVNVGIHGDLHVRDVIYNVNGRTTTFLNPAISAEEVMKNIGDKNSVGADIKIPILAAGFKSLGGYSTISINARASVGAQLPGQLFSLLKEGVSNNSYDLSNTRAFGTAYAEIALGHSHKVGKNLRIGGALKFLVGAGNIDANFRNATLELGVDDWRITTDAELNSSVKNLTYKTKVNKHTGHRYVDGMDLDKFGMNGFGMAVDLGATYDVARDWQLSLAVLDLGFISWKENHLATTNGLKTFNTDRYTFNADKPQAQLRPARHRPHPGQIQLDRLARLDQHRPAEMARRRHQHERRHLRRRLWLGCQLPPQRLQLLCRHGPHHWQDHQGICSPQQQRLAQSGHERAVLT